MIICFIFFHTVGSCFSLPILSLFPYICSVRDRFTTSKSSHHTLLTCEIWVVYVLFYVFTSVLHVDPNVIFDPFLPRWPMFPKMRLLNSNALIQGSGRFVGVTGWDPSVCKSNWVHVHNLRFTFIKLGYVLHIPLKWSVIFPQSWTSTGSSVTNCRFCPIIARILLKDQVFF